MWLTVIVTIITVMHAGITMMNADIYIYVFPPAMMVCSGWLRVLQRMVVVCYVIYHSMI